MSGEKIPVNGTGNGTNTLKFPLRSTEPECRHPLGDDDLFLICSVPQSVIVRKPWRIITKVYVFSRLISNHMTIRPSGYIFLTIFITAFLIQPVSAYLDPGFASMVWQMMAAMAFAAAFTVKIYWQKIRNFFIRPEPNKPRE